MFDSLISFIILYFLLGARDCVEGAKQRMSELVTEWESFIEVKCAIPQKHHGSLLSNKGRDVQELSAKLNVHIKFPDRQRKEDKQQAEPSAETDADNSNDVISISGNKDNVEEAKTALLVS